MKEIRKSSRNSRRNSRRKYKILLHLLHRILLFPQQKHRRKWVKFTKYLVNLQKELKISSQEFQEQMNKQNRISIKTNYKIQSLWIFQSPYRNSRRLNNRYINKNSIHCQSKNNKKINKYINKRKAHKLNRNNYKENINQIKTN